MWKNVSCAGSSISHVIDRYRRGFGSEFSEEPEVENESLQGSVIGPILCNHLETGKEPFLRKRFRM